MIPKLPWLLCALIGARIMTSWLYTQRRPDGDPNIMGYTLSPHRFEERKRTRIPSQHLCSALGNFIPGETIKTTNASVSEGAFVLDRRCTRPFHTRSPRLNRCLMHMEHAFSRSTPIGTKEYPSIDVRLQGPSLLSIPWTRCNSSRFYELDLTAVRDAGRYLLIVEQTYNDAAHAFAKPPLRQVHCTCVTFGAASGLGLYLSFQGDPVPDPASRCSRDADTPLGRWRDVGSSSEVPFSVRRIGPYGTVAFRGRLWEWSPYACRLPVIEGRLQLCKSTLLLGDSHGGVWFESWLNKRRAKLFGLEESWGSREPRNVADRSALVSIDLLGIHELMIGDGYHHIENKQENFKLHRMYWANMSFVPSRTSHFLTSLQNLEFDAFSTDALTKEPSRHPLILPGLEEVRQLSLLSKFWAGVLEDWVLSEQGKLYRRFHLNVSRYGLIVINSGHWDLRDGSVEDYIRAVRELFRDLDNALEGWSGVKVWRSSPPFSLKSSSAMKNDLSAVSREYRTNEKIDEANAIASDIARAAGYLIHDR